MNKLIKDCLTENDGQSYCPVRVIGLGFGAVLILLFVLGWLYIVWSTHKFDPVLFVESASALMTVLVGAISGGVSLKALTDKPLPQ